MQQPLIDLLSTGTLRKLSTPRRAASDVRGALNRIECLTRMATGRRASDEAKLNKKLHAGIEEDGKWLRWEDRGAFSVFPLSWRSGRALLLAAKRDGLKASGKKSHFDAAVHPAAVSYFLDTPKKVPLAILAGPLYARVLLLPAPFFLEPTKRFDTI